MQDWRRSTWALIARGKMSVNFDQDPTDLMFPLRRILYSSLSLSLSSFSIYFSYFLLLVAFYRRHVTKTGRMFRSAPSPGRMKGKERLFFFFFPFFLAHFSSPFSAFVDFENRTVVVTARRQESISTHLWSMPANIYRTCRWYRSFEKKKKRLGSDFFSFFFFSCCCWLPVCFGDAEEEWVTLGALMISTTRLYIFLPFESLDSSQLQRATSNI